MSDSPDLIHPRGRAFGAYWMCLPKRDFLPDRDQIDLAQLKEILPSFVILQYESPSMVRFRLAGTDEVKRYGFEVTGRNYLDFVPDERKAEALQTFETMLRHPCGSRNLIETVTSSGRIVINEAIGYPMRGSDGRADQLMFKATISRASWNLISARMWWRSIAVCANAASSISAPGCRHSPPDACLPQLPVRPDPAAFAFPTAKPHTARQG